MEALLKYIVLIGLVAGAATQALAQADGPDEFSIRVVDGAVVAEHFNAEYNCCMDGVHHDVDVADGVIDITEIELVSDPCVCLCGFSTAAVVRNLPPGEYLVVFHWLEYGAWAQVETAVTVPGAFRDGAPDTESLWSECDGGSVATQGVSFGVLKSYYR